MLGVFLTNGETRDLAHLPMILWALMISFDTLGMVLMNALIGAGDTHRSMWISVIAQWVFFLPAAYVVGPGTGLRPARHLDYQWILPGGTGTGLRPAVEWPQVGTYRNLVVC